MREVCYCGRVGELQDREPVVFGDGGLALRCPTGGCGHLELLAWMPGDAGRFVLEKVLRQQKDVA